MRKLNYNIYKSISDEQYFQIYDELLLIEADMLTYLQGKGWWKRRSLETQDGLLINFATGRDPVHGSLGITFEDKKDVPTFSFGVMKTVDRASFRYSLYREFYKDRTMEEVKVDFLEYCQQALDLYNEWSDDSVLENGQQTPLIGY